MANNATTSAMAVNINWAKATYQPLPRELRDMVYEYLWNDDDDLSDEKTDFFDYIASDKVKNFVDPTIFGTAFAREVLHWYYKHGCFNRRVPLSRLQEFLFGDAFGVGLQAVSCNIRSLHVSLHEDSPETPPEDAQKILKQFHSLINLPLKKGFKLTIRFTMDNGTWHQFLFPIYDVVQELKAVVRAFEAKGCEIEMWFFKKHPRTSRTYTEMMVHGKKENANIDSLHSMWSMSQGEGS